VLHWPCYEFYIRCVVFDVQEALRHSRSHNHYSGVRTVAPWSDSSVQRPSFRATLIDSSVARRICSRSLRTSSSSLLCSLLINVNTSCTRMRSAASSLSSLWATRAASRALLTGWDATFLLIDVRRRQKKEKKTTQSTVYGRLFTTSLSTRMLRCYRVVASAAL
jgi:hypothetical protein